MIELIDCARVYTFASNQPLILIDQSWKQINTQVHWAYCPTSQLYMKNVHLHINYDFETSFKATGGVRGQNNMLILF